MIELLHFVAATTAPSRVGQACGFQDSVFLGFPHWYQYLTGIATSPDGSTTGIVCTPQVTGLSDIWLIVAAAIEILLRVAAIAAVFMVIYGGVKYITSQGEPEATTKARGTIINALVGLLLTVLASVFVAFIARSIS